MRSIRVLDSAIFSVKLFTHGKLRLKREIDSFEVFGIIPQLTLLLTSKTEFNFILFLSHSCGRL